MSNKYGELHIICNGCAKEMRRMGSWPRQFPPNDEGKNTQNTSMYACNTCRIPCKDFESGVPVMVAIIEGIR